MMKMSRLLIAASILCASGLAFADDALDAFFPQSSIVISASSNACYRFDIHLAINDQQRQRGLMHVRQMDEWRGMLFVYPDSDRYSMWMKNTFIPLDMLFIRKDGTISSIARDTEPQSLKSVRAIEDVSYVLELNAGTSDRLGINAGDRMWWSGEVVPPASEN
ncbi:DUF192 domain-containing protein [Woeseia oceani]|nr:DUF192 domain-containing protein [Woeseia oceani]